MKLTKKMTLEQFAIAVATELKKHDIDVILTGGAVVSIYSTGKHVSKDADFLSATDHKTITKVMLSLGFKNVGKDFYHDDTAIPHSMCYGSPGRILSLARSTKFRSSAVSCPRPFYKT
jgi:hypothetical protein